MFGLIVLGSISYLITWWAWGTSRNHCQLSGYAIVADKHQSRQMSKLVVAPVVDLEMILNEVTARLEMGDGVEIAWKKALLRSGSFDMLENLMVDATIGNYEYYTILDERGVPKVIWQLQRASIWQKLKNKVLGIQPFGYLERLDMLALSGVMAACRITKEVGAPLGLVLKLCSKTIWQAAQGQDARTVAIAGPRTTAYILALLPVFGLFASRALGVNFFLLLSSQPIALASVLLGISFYILGIYWVKKLLTKAEKE